MVTLRRSVLLAIGLLSAIFIVACGNQANAASYGNGASQASNVVLATPTMQKSGKGPENQIDTMGTGNGGMKADKQNGMQDNSQHKDQTKDQNYNKNNTAGNMQNDAGNMQNNAQQNGDAGNAQAQTNNGQPNGQPMLIRVVQINMDGTTQNVLATGDGKILYTRSSDPAPNSSCMGACAKTWPPLLSNGPLISSMPLPAKLTIHKTVNGSQVDYDGHPLYTYAGDTNMQQAKGQGLGNVWYVVPVMLQKQHW
ncbi:hypothetical protein EPA93_40100 [Ktedonosporobacter rubrisoli]|uniref:Lipoprotein n=1 Tax=Ktedonosporobacter rubrisoli TaxID=2509675 RepID=A0A4P6K196_KTERU|nr:hypothetical protein [Ktedonosporobacter rubrisoli]QBD81849.1 hypothetical protein EPA93_40100 [Ktedonosporobacter rubrisoli]